VGGGKGDKVRLSHEIEILAAVFTEDSSLLG